MMINVSILTKLSTWLLRVLKRISEKILLTKKREPKRCVFIKKDTKCLLVNGIYFSNLRFFSFMMLMRWHVCSIVKRHLY